jgi:predicted nucleic acid-binding protein
VARTQADLLIAATAGAHNLVLVTRNTHDFEGCGLQLFNPFTTAEP